MQSTLPHFIWARPVKANSAHICFFSCSFRLFLRVCLNDSSFDTFHLFAVDYTGFLSVALLLSSLQLSESELKVRPPFPTPNHLNLFDDVDYEKEEEKKNVGTSQMEIRNKTAKRSPHQCLKFSFVFFLSLSFDVVPPAMRSVLKRFTCAKTLCRPKLQNLIRNLFESQPISRKRKLNLNEKKKLLPQINQSDVI